MFKSLRNSVRFSTTPASCQGRWEMSSANWPTVRYQGNPKTAGWRSCWPGKVKWFAVKSRRSCWISGEDGAGATDCRGHQCGSATSAGNRSGCDRWCRRGVGPVEPGGCLATVWCRL